MAIESTGGARAALDGPDGPLPCALNARGARGRSCSHAQRFGGLAALVVDAALLGWLNVIGPRRCACYDSLPCGIRARAQCGLGSRFGRAAELA